jgi:hypothetical protein
VVHHWGGRTRTYNFLINSQAICQLIYTPSQTKTPVRSDLTSAGFTEHARWSDTRIGVPIIEIIAIERGGVCHNSS